MPEDCLQSELGIFEFFYIIDTFEWPKVSKKTSETPNSRISSAQGWQVGRFQSLRGDIIGFVMPEARRVRLAIPNHVILFVTCPHNARTWAENKPVGDNKKARKCLEHFQA